ncbi:hypothetical protein SB6408_01915 [Klebsiella spallanzanii]|uniref:Uncharacterized protein n=1 Tax=Klebsiella spallanzanii TaxID=2587528 RepID=A0A564N3I1_9ENTR|nr:Uncharacterised protein [Klebsiella quasivariicola]VUT00539.1 hypothetical protein SB6408_01915 [Klebsiella spallanzanii]
MNLLLMIAMTKLLSRLNFDFPFSCMIMALDI